MGIVSSQIKSTRRETKGSSLAPYVPPWHRETHPCGAIIEGIKGLKARIGDLSTKEFVKLMLDFYCGE